MKDNRFRPITEYPTFRYVQKVSTLNNDVIITSYRADGNTTRQVDYAIQLLFKNYIVQVSDHAFMGERRRSNEELFIRIKRRIELEHEGLIRKRLISFDFRNLTIKLLEK